ncbi:MAG: DUF1566 domain-containing protein [Thermoanaerobaculales bacterium]|nr:DUF1566 domain-containing protein [Thermoanaerobaculales bacterium]
MRHWAVVIVVLVVGCSSMAWGQGIEDIVFYDTFESGDTSGWWAPARVGETGQKTCYDQAGTVIDCAGTGQDGDIQSGVAWPEPRFVDNSDGTVTDMLTGLVWLKDASCADLAGTDYGMADWTTALTAAQALADGTCGLTDTSVAGAWRLPSVNELQSLIYYEYHYPALSNAAGTGQWTEGDVVAGVESYFYWSSTSLVFGPYYAWSVSLSYGNVSLNGVKTNTYYVWPVRGGQ